MLSLEEVKHVAQLARLELSSKELKLYSSQLSGILNYIDQLQEIDTSAISLSTEISGPVNAWREDEARDWADDERKLALRQAKEIEKGQIKVRRVLA